MQGLCVSGELKDLDVAELICSLWRSRETGVLALLDGDSTRHLFLDGGRVLFAASSDPEDRLGNWLFKSGRLRLRDLLVLRDQVKSGWRFGELMVERGLLPAEQLAPVVREQLEYLVARAIVAVNRGSYRFEFGKPALHEPVLLDREVGSLLLRAVTQVDDQSRVFRALGSDGGRWQAVAEPGPVSLELLHEEAALLELLRRPRGMEELAAHSRLGEYQLGKVIWGLSLAGAVVPANVSQGRVEAGAEEAPAAVAVEARDGTGQASSVPALEPEPPVRQPELAAALEAFNEKHAYIHRILKVELGTGADGFLKACLRRAQPGVTRLFEGVPMDGLGRWGLERLEANIVSGRIQNYGELLQALVDGETQSLMRLTDHDRGAMIIDGLRVIEQRAGVERRAGQAGP